MIRIWLCSSNGGGSEEQFRGYDLHIDLVEGWSSLTISDDSGVFSTTADAVGLLSVSTTEAMNGHSASLSFIAAHPWGERLRKCLLSQDMLLVEAIGPDGEWDTLFDGFVSEIQWSKEGSPNSYSHRFSVRFEGANRLINGAWENWQGLLRATDSVVGLVGDKMIKDWSIETGAMDPAAMVKRVLDDGIGKLMSIQARGGDIAQGWMQTASGSDWESDPTFCFNIWLAKDWLLRQQGTLAGIINGLVEPELNEFFLTYRNGKPTWVFRPNPFPGPPADGATPADDVRWNSLVPFRICLDNCVGSTGSRNDSRMWTVFQWAGMCSNDADGQAFFGKLFIGAWEHKYHVKKYGFRSRQIKTSLVGITNDPKSPWMVTIPKKIVERIAWQDSPLPWLEQQSRHYPWLPSRVAGLHVGNIVYDTTDGQATGYLVSIQNEVRATSHGIETFTVLGLDRVSVGSSPESYPDDVRKYGDGLRHIEYAQLTNGAASENVDKTNPPTAGEVPSGTAKVRQPCAGTATSEFSAWRAATKSSHNGLDIANALGTDIVSPVDGMVVAISANGPSGNYITILDTATHFTHSLCHLFSVMPGLAVKSLVTAGQRVGAMGNTGHVIASPGGNGSHLHWTVKNANGVPVNPRLLLP